MYQVMRRIVYSVPQVVYVPYNQDVRQKKSPEKHNSNFRPTRRKIEFNKTKQREFKSFVIPSVNW